MGSNGNFQFVLDIAEPPDGSESLLSLDALQIYVSDTGSQNTTILGDLGTPVHGRSCRLPEIPRE